MVETNMNETTDSILLVGANNPSVIFPHIFSNTVFFIVSNSTACDAVVVLLIISHIFMCVDMNCVHHHFFFVIVVQS